MNKIMEQYLWAFWFIAGVVFLILEIFTAGFFISLVGIACFFAGITALFTHNLIIQILVFSVVMVLLLIFVRPVIMKYLMKSDKNRKSAVDALTGQTCLVTEDINPDQGTGYVKVGADYWKAKTSDNQPLTKGTKVVIEKMEGITVTVRKADV